MSDEEVKGQEKERTFKTKKGVREKLIRNQIMTGKRKEMIKEVR